MQFDIVRKHIGFFAELNWVLYCMAYAECVGATPRVRLLSDNYLDSSAGAEWLGQYFQLPWAELPEEQRTLKVELSEIEELPWSAQRIGHFTLDRAHRLATAALRPHRTIEQDVDTFIRNELGSRYFAVHYRGSDKRAEAPSVPPEEFVDVLNVVRRVYAPDVTTVFAASDAQPFIDWLGRELEGFRVVSRRDVIRSTDSRPIHLHPQATAPHKARLGYEALVDCLSLSRAEFLVRSSSFLSGWASVFTPALPVLMLNRPFADKMWFPDRAVLPVSAEWMQRLAGAPGSRPPGGAKM
jgi:hypothetical protein